jgi:L-iditol 2-dehydrogenase
VLGVTKLAPGPGNVALVERPEPTAAAGHVVLEVLGAGICGTDLHIYDDEYPTMPPVTMGHEVSGVVDVVGEGVDEWWRGARVVSETYFSTCGRCEFCDSGRPNLCAERRSIGTHVDGGFARLMQVPVTNLHHIPDWLDGHAASLSEPLACACHSLEGAVESGDDVLVVGPGPVGLLAAQVARAAGGAVHVRGTLRDAARLAKAEQLGFETSAEGPAPAVDVVVDCSGAEAGIAFGLERARRGGRYVQMGLAGKPVTIPFDLVCYKELRVSSGFASTPSSWAGAMQLIEARRVSLEPLVSAVLPLDRWEEAFAATRAAAGIKFVLDPRGSVKGA